MEEPVELTNPFERIITEGEWAVRVKEILPNEQ